MVFVVEAECVVCSDLVVQLTTHTYLVLSRSYECVYYHRFIVMYIDIHREGAHKNIHTLAATSTAFQ